MDSFDSVIRVGIKVIKINSKCTKIAINYLKPYLFRLRILTLV